MSIIDRLRGLLPLEMLTALSNEYERPDTSLIRSGMSEVNISSPSATTTAQEPTFTKIAGTYAAPLLVGFTHSAGAVTLTDPESRIFKVACAITAVASANDTYVFRAAVNGTSLAKSEQRRLISGVSDVGSIVVVTCITLAQGDTVELEVAREGVAAATCTAQRLNFIVSALT